MKRAHVHRSWLLILITLLLGGCASVWTHVDATNAEYQSAHYRLTLPLGWVRIAAGENLVITRDGPAIQMIAISFHPHEKAFEKLEKDSSTDLLPSELAELYVAEFKAQDPNGLPSLEILSNEPAQIAGHQGFRLHLGYTSDTGLQYQTLVTGFVNKDGLFVLRYIAPSLHFFVRDQEIFQSTVNGFRTT